MTQTLSPSHLQQLTEGSGLSEDIIRQRGYRTCTGYSELKSLGIVVRRDTHTQGLLLPLYTTEGKPGEAYIAKEDRSVPLTLYRPDIPQVSQDGAMQKYLYPWKQGMRLDCHPHCQPLLSDPSTPLYVTEGTKKADALVSHGLCALALLGVSCWRSPDWHAVALKNRQVIIVFDSDLTENPQARTEQEKLAQFLTAKRAIVHAAYLPSAEGDKVGIDDYLLTHTVADLARLIEAPRQAKPKPTSAIPTLKLTTKGEPRPVLSNILDILTQDSRWQGVVGYDAFAQVETLTKCPPYLSATGSGVPRPLQDHDDAETSNWLQREYDLCAATSLVAEAIQMTAHRNPYHPVREYLAGLHWDGTPRLDAWLTTYCRVKETPYTRKVGPKTLISAIARIEKPGCKADCVTILRGAQGLLKSTVWRTLAGDDWFSDTMPDIDRKDAMEGLHGKWIIELGELAVLQRSEREAIKRFVSATADHYRPSYGRRAATFPRHTIFVGSTNKEQFFQDETGNRRFWPVLVEGTCDIAALQRDRDQLWAEAYDRYQKGEPWYLSRPDEALAEREQEECFEVDPWEETLLEYIQDKTFVTTRDILTDCLGMENPALHTQMHTKRLGAILRRHKWQSNKPVWVTDGLGKKKQIKAWKPPLVTSVTADTKENQATGNAVNSCEIDDITDITDVTVSVIDIEDDKSEKEEKTQIDISQASMEKSRNGGNKGNRGNAPPCPPPTPQNGQAPPPQRCPHCERRPTWLIRDIGYACCYCQKVTRFEEVSA